MEIEKLVLKCTDLDSAEEFYNRTLGFDLNLSSSDMLGIQVGKTNLVFEKDLVNPKPYYHFAFLIPKNKLEEALNWIESKVPILKNGDGGIWQFPNWNANSIYFYDPNGNILEMICRYDLENESSEVFSSKSIISINEVGLAHESPLILARTLNSDFEIGYFSKGPVSEEFVAMGDENGLLVISGIKRNWYPTNQTARAFWLEITIKVNGVSSIMNLSSLSDNA